MFVGSSLNNTAPIVDAPFIASNAGAPTGAELTDLTNTPAGDDTDVDMVKPVMIVTIRDLGEVSDVNGVATLLPMLEEGMQESHLPAKNRGRQLGRSTIQFKEL